MGLARATRSSRADVPQFVRDYVQWGAGPRASQYIVLGAKARAVLHGRFAAERDDVQAVALPVLRHRIKTSFAADAEGVTADQIVERILQEVSPLTEEKGKRGQQPEVFRASGPGTP